MHVCIDIYIVAFDLRILVMRQIHIILLFTRIMVGCHCSTNLRDILIGCHSLTKVHEFIGSRHEVHDTVSYAKVRR